MTAAFQLFCSAWRTSVSRSSSILCCILICSAAGAECQLPLLSCFCFGTPGFVYSNNNYFKSSDFHKGRPYAVLRLSTHTGRTRTRLFSSSQDNPTGGAVRNAHIRVTHWSKTECQQQKKRQHEPFQCIFIHTCIVKFRLEYSELYQL